MEEESKVHSNFESIQLPDFVSPFPQDDDDNFSEGGSNQNSSESEDEEEAIMKEFLKVKAEREKAAREQE